MAHIRCEDVSLAYEGKTVVSKLNMTVSRGEYLCIVGENGSGKTTLLKALAGLKKPTNGGIYRDGFSRENIGYMPQQSELKRDFPATVKEVVRSGLKTHPLRPFFTKAEQKKMQQAVELLEIEDVLSESFSALSGGQQQRVLLARALCATDSVLLLDEPVTGLDPAITARLYELISKLHQTGMTVIMISHDVENAVKHATHILHLDKEPLFFGTAADYISSGPGKRFLRKGAQQ